MIRIVPNSGTFNDERLDGDRAAALTAIHAEQTILPEALVYYIRALEARLLDEIAERKRRSAAKLWAFSNLPRAPEGQSTALTQPQPEKR